jgi:hypothetical protein
MLHTSGAGEHLLHKVLLQGLQLLMAVAALPQLQAVHAAAM